MSLEADAARGHRAFHELEEVSAAFERVRGAILAELAQTPVSQPEKVLKLHMAVSNLTAVREAMQHVIDNGEVARAAIAQAGLTRPL